MPWSPGRDSALVTWEQHCTDHCGACNPGKHRSASTVWGVQHSVVQSKPSMMASLSLVVSLRPQLSRPTLEAVGCTQFTLSACLFT